ncbi:MAG: ParA family protein [Oscillospiraceae bacterium]|nr:ParA family protein [Oscillospiraceae bacterium]
MAEVIAIANQKGGVGKTMSTINMGISMVRQGKKVLLIDADPQGTMTNNLGFRPIERLPATLDTLLKAAITGKPMESITALLKHDEGVDVLPANIQLSGSERDLVISNDRTVFSKVLDQIRPDYDYILIDCMPSLGALTLNVLTAADSVIIPVQAGYEASQGLQQLMRTIASVKQQLNPDLKISGVLLTMVDEQTNLAKTISSLIRDTYGSKLHVFANNIPRTVRLAETGPEGKSIFTCSGRSDDTAKKAAHAYESAAKEVIAHGEKQRAGKHQPDVLR